MSKNPSVGDVARCRADMAKLLTEALETTCKIERRLDASGGWREATAAIDINADPGATVRIAGALLLRKARIHIVAVLRANETSNLHSLAVQMRPVLECAGQVVFIFHNTIIAPDLLMSQEDAAAMFGNRLNADFYQTFRSKTKGQISLGKLREMATRAQADAAASVGAPNPTRQKSWTLRQADKMKPLAKGHEWYNYLSNRFAHGNLARTIHESGTPLLIWAFVAERWCFSSRRASTTELAWRTEFKVVRFSGVSMSCIRDLVASPTLSVAQSATGTP